MLEIFGGLEIFAQIGFHLSQGGTDPRGESGGGRFAGHGGWKHKQVECLAVPWRGNLLFAFMDVGVVAGCPCDIFLRYLAATWSAVILNTSLALTAMMSLGTRFCNFAFWIPGTEREAMPQCLWEDNSKATACQHPHSGQLAFTSHHTISWLFFFCVLCDEAICFSWYGILSHQKECLA